ncbi:MAG TPA: transglutaminase domain-containing protein, partial [Candidatus Angelobacter sp.]
EFFERFMGDHKETKQAALEAMGSETDPEKKLRKLYARAQQIRNLSYERERSREEREKEKLKPNEGVVEILKRGYGDKWDIVLAFVAMARAAGFEASVLAVSNREKEFFYKEVLSSRQLDSLIADVKLNGKDVYLDPGTKFCPFGLIRWMRTSTQALRPDKKTPTLVTVPSATVEKAVTRRLVNATLDADGALKADLVVKYEGTEALERRLAAVGTDDAGKKKQLEDEVKSWLSDAAVVKMLDAQGWEGSEEPLSAHFSIEVAGYASSAGKRIVVPSYLFRVKQKDAFVHADRKYPVYFPYAFAELDTINIAFPGDHTLESSPQNQEAKLPYASYRIGVKFQGNHLVMQRTLALNGIYFPVTNYSEVKDFFNKVQVGDEQQAVLHGGGTTSAQKGN